MIPAIRTARMAVRSGPPDWPGRAGLGLEAAGQVASAQPLSRRVRPRPTRLRRFSAAVRRLSQAWFLVTPR